MLFYLGVTAAILAVCCYLYSFYIGWIKNEPSISDLRVGQKSSYLGMGLMIIAALLTLSIYLR